MHRAEPPPAVTQIGRFLVLGKLGEGGMGVVYSAFDPVLDRRVAIKVIRPELGDEASNVLRLQREAQAMARLSHPNVVPVYDVGNLGSSLFVALEHVVGSTLAEWLSEKPRGWAETLALYLQAGRGLEAAHAAGLIHRDFKPTNVLLGKDGRARVSDFGLAREESAGTSTLGPSNDGRSPEVPPAATPLTRAGAILGSVGYMAPEQYRGERVSAAADQYSFCVALYEALYGYRPFRGADARSVAALAEAGEVPRPPKGSPVPEWLFEVVAKGLAPDPAKRHASMTALLASLEDDPIARRRRRLSVAFAVMLVGAAVVAGVATPRLRVSACEREGERFAQAWTPAVQADTEAAFLATGLPFAGASWEQARLRLAQFSRAWVAERARACRETLSEGTRTKWELELRLRCLDQRGTEFETLAAQLLHADAKMVERAVVASSSLTPVARCADFEWLEARAGRRPETHRTAELIEHELAQARVLVALARFDDASALLQAATLQARELGEPQLVGLAALELGVLRRYQQKYPDAQVSLQEALRKSLEGRDDRTALEAVGQLVSVIGFRLEKPQEALTLFDVGVGLVPRVADPRLEALLYEGQGDALAQAGEAHRSLEAYEHALEALERSDPANPIQAASLRASIGFQEMEFGHVTRALEFYRRAKRDRESLGPGHPFLILSHGELAAAAEALDELEAAREGFAQERAAFEKQSNAGMRVVVSRVNLARVLAKLGRPQEALALLAAAEADLKPEYLSGLRIELAQIKGLALLAAGRLPEAEAVLRGSLAPAFESFGAGSTEIAEIRVLLARALVAQGKHREAIAELERAQKVLIEAKDLESVRHAEVLVEWAGARAELAKQRSSDWASVLDLAERAATAAEALEGNARLKARALLLLAEARWQVGKRAEGVDAARRSAKHASASSSDAASAQAWLAGHALAR